MKKRMQFVYLGLTAVLIGAVGLALLAFASPDSQVFATEQARFRVTSVVSGLEHPWGMAFLSDGRVLVTERPGRLRLIRDGQLQMEPVAGLPEITPRGQGGLLDVALHPRFSENHLVYLSYSSAGGGGVGTEVARGRLEGNRLEDLEILFRMAPKSQTGRHFGSRLVFDRQEHLYITLGDRGERRRAQIPDDHAGSVIRLHADGRVPDDNPFIDREGWQPEIYSYGHRNIQGAALHPVTGLLWTHEHGPQGGDEVNVIRPGRNYGWPVITYGANYGSGSAIGEGTHKPGMEQPLHYWVPSIAPSGMAFYRGQAFPEWNGDLFVGALRDQMLVRLELEGERIVAEERLMKNAFGRIRAVTQGPDGLLYLLTDEGDGQFLRLEPVAD